MKTPSSDWDRIRLVGDGTQKGLGNRLLRNGTHVPGLKGYELSQDHLGVVTLTTRQYVILEDEQDILEEAVQALKEREAAWQDLDEPEVPSGGPD